MTLRFLTAGESHGLELTAILEGLPAGVPITAEIINEQLARRQLGYGRGGRMKIESDQVQITGGVRHGKTLGSPISLRIENRDHQAWREEMSVEPIADFVSKKSVTCPRPGHADLAGGLKFGFYDLRNVLERASARETAARVAVGAVCRQFLKQLNIEFTSKVIAVGAEKNPAQMNASVDLARKAGDTLGGIAEVLVSNVPAGIGSYSQWDQKLDAQLAAMTMSIPSVKGCEIGLGFASSQMLGSQVHDAIAYDEKQKKFYHTSNNAGGLTGGITNGEDIILRAAFKPISTLYEPLPSIDITTKTSAKAAIERSDTSIIEAGAVILENLTAIVIAKATLQKFGGDSLEETCRNWQSYQQALKLF